jgi:hypothetical protein
LNGFDERPLIPIKEALVPTGCQLRLLSTLNPTIFLERHGRVLEQLNRPFDAVPVIVMRLPNNGRVLFLPHAPACRVTAHHEAVDMRVVNQFAFEGHEGLA